MAGLQMKIGGYSRTVARSYLVRSHMATARRPRILPTLSAMPWAETPGCHHKPQPPDQRQG